MPSVLTVGEALVDIVDGDAPTAHAGGSPLNVSVGLARLGITSRLHTSLADDPHGRLIRAHLIQSGVALTPESWAAARTSVARARIRTDGSAAYDFHVDWNPEAIDVSGFDLVHTGSIGALMLPGAAAVRAMVEGATGLVSFDPNIRPDLLGRPAQVREAVEDLVRRSDIVKASDEDLGWLYPTTDHRAVMERWQSARTRVIVVTRGSQGADALVDGRWSHEPTRATHVVDTIGAGDAFMSGLLFAVLQSGLDDADEAVVFASRCAALTVSTAGANPPYLRHLGELPASVRRPCGP